MSLLYKIGVRGYALGASIAGLFSPKARARVLGSKNALSQLEATPAGKICYWMHCASVGEFEQGRPLWDKLMKEQPNARFVLSFFSPSGHEVFKHKPNLGEVVYLPWDIGKQANTFVKKLSPKLAVFVKYEWWLGYFEALATAKVPTVLVSAAFRQNQPFFRPNVLRSAYQKALFSVHQVFVQDHNSADLLKSIGFTDLQISGDTRIDRTLSNREATLDSPLLLSWAEEAPYVLVAGSTWLPDVEVIAQALRKSEKLSLLIAPHEVDAKTIAQTIEVLAEAVHVSEIKCLSQLRETDAPRVVVVDSIGLLSKLYRLGSIAYIGGGFGTGIHNTLEAVVYGIPLAFGPKHDKFQEAIALADQKIATVVANAKDLSTFAEKYSDSETRKGVLAKAEMYIAKNRGATQRIWNYLIEQKLI